MPPDVVDGEVAEDESPAAAVSPDAAHANVNEVAINDDEAARRLEAMQGEEKLNPDA
jgi:hypothetical protein